MVIKIIDDETGEPTGEIILEPKEYKAVLDFVDPERKMFKNKNNWKWKN